MRRAVLGTVVTVGLLLGVSGGLARGAGNDRVRLEVVVTSEEKGEPIENAVVYVKFKEERLLRRDKQREWNTKTNQNGKAVFPELPEGRVLVQVVATGWKTYGRFHTLRGPKHILEIKLKPPRKWY